LRRHLGEAGEVVAFMSSKDRVLAACAFKPPDRIPRIEFFWEYPTSWEKRFGPVEALNDVIIWSPNEGTFLTGARRIKEDKGYIYEVDKWGRTVRSRKGAFFVETLEVPFSDVVNIETIQFEPPELESRFLTIETETILDIPLIKGKPSLSKVNRALRQAKGQGCVFGKTGGPYLRSTYMRGEKQFLIDIAEDPVLAKVIADKVAAHLIAVGIYANGFSSG